MTQPQTEFIHTLTYDQIPDGALHAARRALLDLLGVAAAGEHKHDFPTLSDKLRFPNLALAGPESANRVPEYCSMVGGAVLQGAAMGGGMMIDSVDAHDGQ